ncbi:MAG TPA: ankyrin repeat domain-containing protein [Alphaproteobacteria bacterium]|nr:ankyrin repeat domain-containing protein [Alphaproteobacteria bacterium]
MQPPRPWPNPPPRNHPDFYLDGLLSDYTPARGGADYFFCYGLAPKSAEEHIMAAAVTGDVATLRTLLQKNPDLTPDFSNGNGVTPLMVAAARGHSAVVHLLADHPLTGLSQQTRQGWSALHYAAYFGQSETAGILMQRQADFTLKNAFGEEAFALAKNPETEKAFLDFKPFVRHLKRQKPQHPHFAPKLPQTPLPEAAGDNAPAPATAAKERETKPDTPSDFFTLLLRASFSAAQYKTTAADALFSEMQRHLARGDNQPVFEAYEKIERATEKLDLRGKHVEFNWDGLLAAAAVQGNIPALVFFAEKRNYLDSAPLTNALAAIIDARADTPQTAEAAQWLMRWGADVNASAKKLKDPQSRAGTLAYQAFNRRMQHVFGAVSTHAGDLKSWHVSPAQLLWEQQIEKAVEAGKNGAVHKPGHFGPIGEGIAVLKIRAQLHHTGHEKLTRLMDSAAQESDMRGIAAAYAEARTDRLFRGAFNVPKETGAAAMLTALEHGKTGFAKHLAADGHSLHHLQDTYSARMARLRQSDDAAVRAFIRADMAGEKIAPDILSIDDKYKILRGQAARYPVSGRGFGF